MTETPSIADRISFARGSAGVLAAIVFYLLGSFLISVVTAVPVTLMHLDENGVLLMARLIAAAIGGAWFSRRATDWLVKRYSGRAVFVAVLSILLVSGTAAAMSLPFDGRVISDFIQLIVLAVAFYYFYWRRESEAPDAAARRVDNGREATTAVLGCLPSLLFIAVGLIQLSAVSAEIGSVTHLNGFFSGTLSLLLTYFPIIGSITGFFGAKDVWGWPWWQAALLYLGLPTGIFILTIVGSAIGATLQSRPSNR